MDVMISEAIYLHYLNALLDGDKKQCSQIVQKLINAGIDLKDIYLSLFQRSMYRIGLLWEKERCSVADEHIATKITEGLIELVSNNFTSEKRNGKLALITCIDKEFHELGARMVAIFFEASGWNTIFAGSNTPDNDIISLIKEKQPDIVGISIGFYININRLINLVQVINETFPDQEILVGGQALGEEYSVVLSEFGNVHYITCLNGLANYLTLSMNN